MLHSIIRRGELDRECTFLKPVYGSSDSNEDKITHWEEVSTNPTVMLRKVDLKGTDVMMADRPTYAQRTLFTGDYRTDIKTINRLYCEGKVYEIIAITDNNKSRNVYTDFMCALLDTEVWT